MENENVKIGLSFGCLSDKLCFQLDKQKLKYNGKKIAEFQEYVDAVNLLRFEYLTDKMKDKIVSKLNKQIVRHVAKENKLKINKK